MATSYFDHIKHILEGAANSENAGPMKAYMRNQFEFLGTKTPERNVAFKSLISNHGLPAADSMHQLITKLWQQPEREYQYVAMSLLAKIHKQWTEKDIALFEFMIVNKSWWDTVDAIATLLVGPWFKKFPAFQPATTNKWIDSDNMWLQRAAIIFQNGYKKSTDEQLLFRYIIQCSADKEFFIQKAIGWALREYSKTNPASVKKFVSNTTLAPLSSREALKRIIK
ncbi:DNA alkylation repair protein [Chitinophaga silvatica]|uniref:DNA alkylation repair protein n=1 Tax=Chitinophaga silvatica TaxID=2282649 RepID=A0A3E1Y9S1_9BACT|nr:DNA alkylation repair protein [Chitinophaga silvatica]RFS22407.1 DNA alkylation repair protein [Chitinophaga silvatica]